MRKNFLPFLFFSLLIAGLSSCTQAVAYKIIYTVDFDWLEGCETGKGDCNPVILERRSIDDSIRMIFPSGGTSTVIDLYTLMPERPLLEDHKRAGEGRPLLDLTGLPDGNYRTQMYSCGLGGGFTVIIQTRTH
jgi:hypothetical protein